MSRKHHSPASAPVGRDASFPVDRANSPPPLAVQAGESSAAFAARPAEDDAAPKFDLPLPEAFNVETPQFEAPTPLLTKLLNIADMYRAEDSVHQAMSIYFELAEKHAGAPEAYDALERLLDIAKNYEDAGEFHQARSLYERLL